MAEETITLRLVAQDLMSGNVSKAISGLDKLAKQGGLVGSVMQGVGQSFGQMLNPVGLVTSGISALTDIVGDSMAAFREDQVSQAQLRAALEANIESWNGNTDAIEEVIAARMKLGFSDDEQRASLSNIVALVGDVNDSLAVQRDAMDLARLKSISLSDASLILARAYTGNVTALAKMGIHVKKGVSGMEALAGVEERVAGQAEAFSKTSTGAMEAFNVKVGELEEKLGGLLEGPADMFVGWASNIVDVLDGPEGANKKLRDMAAQIYGLRQAASPVTGELMKNLTNQLSLWNDTLTLQEFNGTPESFQWLKDLGPSVLRNFGAASADTLADVRALAQAFIDKFGYSEATFRKFRAAIDEQAVPGFNILTDTWGMTSEQVAENGASMSDSVEEFTKTWLREAARAQGGGESWSRFLVENTDYIRANLTELPQWMQRAAEAAGIVQNAAEVTEKGAREFGHDMNRMRFAVGRATSDMLRTMADALDPWRTAWAEMAAWAKDPFSEKKLAAWIEKKTNEAAQKAIDAAKNHQAAVARRWQAIADAMKSPVLLAAVEMGTSVDDAIAAILRAKNLGSTLGPLGPGGTGGTIQDSMPNHPQAWWDAHPGAARRWGHPTTSRRTGGRNNNSPDTTDNRPPDQGPQGVAVSVTINALTVPTEQEADRLAKSLAPALRRHLNRQAAD